MCAESEENHDQKHHQARWTRRFVRRRKDRFGHFEGHGGSPGGRRFTGCGCRQCSGSGSGGALRRPAAPNRADPGRSGKPADADGLRQRRQKIYFVPRVPHPRARDEHPFDESVRRADPCRRHGQRHEAQQRQHRRRHAHGHHASVRQRGSQGLL